MKHFLLALLLLLIISPSSLSAKPKIKESKSRYWTWAYYSDTRDWEAYFQTMQSVGMDGVIMMAGRDALEKIIPLASKYDIEIQAWAWVMNNGGIAHEHPEWLDYNALGYSLKDSMAYVGYYKFLNPAIAGVREAIAKNFEQLAQTEGLVGISLDYCRYVDAILPENLWGGYGITQDKIYPKWDYGYHPVMVEQFIKKQGYDPRTNVDKTAGAPSPTDEKWLNFRCSVLNKFVDSLSVIIKKHGVNASASPFPSPEMAKEMVVQDWSKWPLNMAFPMIYHGFYKDAGVEWIAKCVSDCRKDMNPKAKLFYGFHSTDFNNPNSPTITQATDAAFANGADGLAMYTFDSLNEKQRQELKQVIENHKKALTKKSSAKK